MRALVWFRADLRTDDNPALHQACAGADRGVVAVFALCARQWQAHDWADIRLEFLLRNLACLAESLRKLNIPLRLVTSPTFAGVPAALLQLARRHDCDTLLFNREYEVNELRRDDAVTRAFADDGRTVRAFDGTVILPPDAVRTREGGFYTVFTPYKRAWLARAADDRLLRPCPRPRPQPEPVCPPDPIPERIEGFDLDKGRPERWPAGEGQALRRLCAFIGQGLDAYRRRRDRPALDGTSRLSPYLAAGVLSPRRCLREAQEANAGRLAGGRAGPDTWISELIWREFYRHVLLGFPRISMQRAFQPATERIRWRTSERDLAAWCAGRTGFPLVDAGMRELAATGWMHNRVRMVVAMFLAKDLLIDWRLGERHFMRHLIDGDLASNNGGWQWSASTGTDAAPYFRIFNPASQAAKFDPEGEYIRAWVPELRRVPPRALVAPGGIPADERRRVDYPLPICDHRAARERALSAFRAARRRAP